jgi:hypothetical protein
MCKLSNKKAKMQIKITKQWRAFKKNKKLSEGDN